MTAEVAILNKSAVALAADSAVTIGDGDSGKVYNTVNKLFTLSKRYPIGLMIYANAEYMGVPFETVVKMFRAKLGNQSFATVEQYAAAFVDYLRDPLFSSKQQQASNILRIWSIVFDSIRNDVRQSIAEYTPDKIEQAIEAVTAQHLTRLRRAATYPGLETVNLSNLFKEHREQWEAIRHGFGFAAVSKSVQRAWRRIAEYALVREHASYQAYSGIVVAGFGESEIFPHVAVTRTGGLVAGVPRYDPILAQGIEHDGHHSGILPFAQSEMVERFLSGVDMQYERYVAGSIVSALRELAKAIIDVHVPGSDADKAKIRSQVERMIGSQTKVLRGNAKRWRSERFEEPVMRAVVNLPKEELANLAEALVNLTSIKRRVSTERETVGGPIDVAVISKGDGFVWIKRKHYFKTELNPHFVPNYNNPIPAGAP